MQGACVCHLVKTAVPLGIVTDRNEIEWLKYFEESRSAQSIPHPKTIVAELPELLKRIRRANSAGNNETGSNVSLSDREFQWWNRVHTDLRNQFVHFAPQGWSIELSGIPALISLTVRIIREIENKGWAFRHEDANWKADFNSILAGLESWAESQ